MTVFALEFQSHRAQGVSPRHAKWRVLVSRGGLRRWTKGYMHESNQPPGSETERRWTQL